MSASAPLGHLATPLKIFGVAVLYALLAKLVLAHFSVNGVISVVWPSSGLALAAILLGGKRYAAGVFLGAFLANANMLTPGAALLIAAGNTLEALAGAWLLTRDGKFDSRFESLRDYLRLIVVAGFFAAGVSAVCGSATLWITGFLSADTYVRGLLHWWMGDAIGVVLVAPVMLVWRQVPTDWFKTHRIVEVILVLGLTFLIGQVIFLNWFHDTLGAVARGYWMYLLVTWAAVRLGTRGVVFLVLMVAIQALAGVVLGAGFFADDMAKTQLANFWFYTVILSLSGMALATYITERNRSDEALRKFARAVEQSANTVVITDVAGNIEYTNPKFTATTGYTREEALGKNPRILKSGHTGGDEYRRMWQTVMAGHEWHGEFHNKRKDGSLYWESAAISPIRNEKGEISNFLAVKEDITARREAEDALQRLNQELEQRVKDEVSKNMSQERMMIQQSRLAAMGEMIHNIAHQWRQPINALTLLLSNIKDAYDYNELTREYLDGEVKTGQRLIHGMSTTIDDFRNFFLPNREKEFFLVNDSVEDAIRLVKDSFAVHGIHFIREGGGEPCIVLGYPNEFAQVALNALTNAKEAILASDAAGEIRIRISKNDDTVTVSIRDNGGGISPEVLPKVFDPYFTTKESGSGVGLYMSKMIMKNMGGDIAIGNIEGGAEAFLSLPLAGSPDNLIQQS